VSNVLGTSILVRSIVKYGAQPQSGYYDSHYAGDFQSEYGYKKREFVTSSAQRSGRSQESFRYAREENFRLQRRTEKIASRNVKLSSQAGDFTNHYGELHNGGKSDRKLFGDRRYRNWKQLDESEYETVDEWSDDESDIQTLNGSRLVPRSRSEQAKEETKQKLINGNGSIQDEGRHVFLLLYWASRNKHQFVRKRNNEGRSTLRRQDTLLESSEEEDEIVFTIKLE
jgi:hypothetical protein